ncbi:hypothetical protein HOE67_01270 [Candidatus Peregrinibacteria bacterium]|nr:hypothetical protein [Candidatus Peregrinibacteria bacterium]
MDRYHYDQRRLESRGHGGHGSFHYFFPFLMFVVVGLVFVFGFKLYTFFYGGFEDYTVMYVAEGEAQLKLWGNEDFAKAYDGTKILQGDEIYTIRDSKVVVEFFDSTVLRLAGDTHVLFDEVFDDGGKSVISLVLKKGEIWVNKTSAKASDTSFNIVGEHVVVSDLSGVLDWSFDSGVVGVVSGNVDLEVYSENNGIVVDHFVVESGNAAVFDQEKLDRFWKFQAPNVVEEISENFVASEWYLWNLLEDEDPTDFSVVEVIPEIEEEVVEEADEVEEVVEPVVVEDPVEKVVEEVVLDLGPLGVPVIFEVGGEVWDGSMFEEGVFVTAEPVIIKGKGSGAAEVVVNNYTLQRFEPAEGDVEFSYWMKEEFNNLQEGENVIEAYALNADGVRSASVYFKVIYEKGEAVVEDGVLEF